MRRTAVLKHAVVLSSLVMLIVCVLIYSISPGEIEIIYSAARYRLARETSSVVASTAEEDASRAPEPAARIANWLEGRQAVAAWLMLASLPFLGGYVRRKRSRRAAEQRMAVSLAKAMREALEPEIHYGDGTGSQLPRPLRAAGFKWQSTARNR
jgi:hypothetical protein